MIRFPRAPAVFLDFDGCLVELAPTPMAVRVPNGLPALLMRLQRATGGALAIVSGRPIDDLRRFIGQVPLVMIGSHGAQRTRGRGPVATMPVDHAVLAALQEGARDVVTTTPGTLLEIKPVAVGLHYRGVPGQAGHIQAEAARLADAAPGFHTHQSKMLVEIRPDGIGKGHAVAELLRRAPFRGRGPVVAGDDATDEPAFAVANARGGVSIKIGAGPSGATSRVATPSELRAALTHLANRLEHRP